MIAADRAEAMTTDPPPRVSRKRRRPQFTARWALAVILLIQVLCAGFFIFEILDVIFGIRAQPLPWVAHELIEIGAALGLILGVVVGGLLLIRSETQRREAEGRLAALAGGFHDLLQDRFVEWALTPAERDVATFVLKGLSIPEIAAFRETSEGTVKAQTAAIYRKAGVSGRGQLVSLFIEDLMSGDVDGIG